MTRVSRPDVFDRILAGEAAEETPQRKEPTDFLCLALSPRHYICNEPPKHDGDHIAWVGRGVRRREVDRWGEVTRPRLDVHGPVGS